MKTKNLKFLILMLMAVSAFALTGCSDDDDNPVAGGDMGSGAMLRVVHASPDAPAVDVYAKGVADPLIINLDYTNTSDYLELDPGTYVIQLRGAGADPSSAPAYETGELNIPDGAVITAVAAGLLGSSDADDMFRVIPLVEDWQDPGAGNAAVRIVHASADAPAVAIDVFDDADPEITNFARFAETGPAGVPLPAGSALDVAIWAGNPLGKVTTFQTPALPEANIILIATGLLGELPRAEAGFGLLAVGPAGTVGLIRQNPTVFVLHGSPDAPAVDVFVGGTMTELVDGLSFSELSPAVQVPPASYDLDIKVASTGGLATTITTPVLMAGERYLAVATGFALGGDPVLTVLPLADEFGEDAGALVRAVHASPGSPAVDIGVVDGSTFTALPEFSNVSFGQASAGPGLAVPAAALTLGVAATGSPDPLVTFSVALNGGQKAFAIAAGVLGDVGQSFRLLLVDVTSFPWAAVEVLPDSN